MAGWWRWLVVALAMAAGPVVARSPAAVAPDPALTRRLAEIVAILGDRGSYDATFAPVFRAAVPNAQFAAIAAQLRAAIGAPTGIESVTTEGTWSADVTIGFARGTATARVALDPAAPHQVTGLLISGTHLRGDSAAKLGADFRALPGEAGFGIYALGSGEPTPIAGWRGDAGAPLGSAFKLWLLAEASRQVQAGTRHWTDVVPVGAPSLPSGILRDWPAGSPATLHTLATLTISISDNTAADTLLALLGRDRVGALALDTRSVEAARTLPVLSTREAFLIKADQALRTAWLHADLSARQALLAGHAAAFAAAPLSLGGIYGDGRPLAPETVEWFASPLEMARLLDWLRVHGDDTARAILAVSAGTDAGTAGRFAYTGFKGGSEPGVITLNYLVRTKAGRWLAVTGNWHRSDGETPTPTFTALMNRALALAAAS